MLEAIGIGIVVLIWIVSSLIKGFKWVLRQTGATQPPPTPAAPPRSQSAPLGQGQFSAQPPPRLQSPPRAQTPPVRVPPQFQTPPGRPQAPPRSIQPSAGGPAVPVETDRRDFERQEQELFASEPASLSTPLVSAPIGPAARANSLFSNTDDLVRAIILREVLGPPLSRRSAASVQPPQPPQ